MKFKIALFLLPVLFLSACREEKTEILSDTYITYADSLPYVLSSEKEMSEIIKDLKLRTQDNEKQYRVQVFVNEQGTVDKINLTENIGKASDTFSEKMAEAFSKVKFKPAVLDGKKVKSQTIVSLTSEGITGAGTKWGIEPNAKSNMSPEGMLAADLPDSLRGEIFFVAAERMPEPVGGIAAIQQKIKYPEIAKRAGIEGKVFIRAYINEQGKVIHTSVIKGLGAGIDEAAMDAIKQTVFKPAMQRGKPVKTQVSVPIIFRLQ